MTEEDPETHYDLGVAYREMSLFDDAIAEFEIARRSAEYAVICCMMIGLCHAEAGRPSQAIDAFRRGLLVEQITSSERRALLFELSRIHERIGDVATAAKYYEQFLEQDPAVGSVEYVLARLRPKPPKPEDPN